jgi:fibro-slime domain-containing protein
MKNSLMNATSLMVAILALGGCNPQGGTVSEGTPSGGAGAKTSSTGAGGQGGETSESGTSTRIISTLPDAAVIDAPAGHCGNGRLDDGEQCDDGNTEGGDGCSRICQTESNWDCRTPGQPCINLARCGNKVLTSNEACDDGNTMSGDGCSADCQAVEPGWLCRVPGKPCLPQCGDGVLAGNETCDDGNRKSGDGCSATCRLELGFKCEGSPSKCTRTTCGDGKREGTEGCDDGNTLPFDGCSAECQLEPDCTTGACSSHCGDGLLVGEDCDDGNTTDADGCGKDCRVESGWTCKQPDLGEKMEVPVVYRDFRFHKPAEFEPDDEGKAALVGLVKTDLDQDGKPVYTGLTAAGCSFESVASFGTWYRNTANVNHATAGKLPLWRTSKGSYVNRYGANGEQWKSGIDGNPLFFPVDGDTFTPASERKEAFVPAFYDTSTPTDMDPNGGSRLHNFAFTSEVRYWFKYETGNTYQLDFVGDDDVWVFINRKLAVDLGGLHPPIAGSVTLNTATATKLGNLQSGKVYEVAVFQAERHSSASSYKLTLTGFNMAPSSCVPACGDGVAVADEECDNGKDNNDSAYAGCTTKCKWGAFCGNGEVNGNEECDNGKDNGMQYGSSGCTFSCTRPHFCGDGQVDSERGEECDLANNNGALLDGNGNPSSSTSARIHCTDTCKIPPSVIF